MRTASARFFPGVIFSLLLFITVYFTEKSAAQNSGNQQIGGPTVNVQMTNQSSRSLQVLRGGRPGEGNNAGNYGNFPNTAGALRPGATITVPSVKGRVWSFMLNGKLVSSHKTTSRKNQTVVVSQAQLAKVTGNGGGGGGAANPPRNPGQPGVPMVVNNPGVGKGKGVPPVANNPGGGRIAGNTGSKVSAAEAEAVLKYHNQKRREVGTAPLKWSNKIARYAQSRADAIARSKRLAHLPQGQNPYGENLAQSGSTGGNSTYTAKNGAEDWYKEKSLMPNGAAGRTMTNALFNRGVGHYTQMVWKGTTEIGAGVATYQQNGFTMTVIVCCYDPPGNMLGAPVY